MAFPVIPRERARLRDEPHRPVQRGTFYTAQEILPHAWLIPDAPRHLRCDAEQVKALKVEGSMPLRMGAFPFCSAENPLFL